MSTENQPALWKSMDSARRVMGYEIIAARFGRHLDGTPMCEKSPFVSFWMQHSGKFYDEPTHWLCELPIDFPSLKQPT